MVQLGELTKNTIVRGIRPNNVVTIVDTQWQGRELYIIAGRDGMDGIPPANGYEVSIHSYLWKVVLVMERPGQGIADVTKNTIAFAVFIPNDSSVAGTNWRDQYTHQILYNRTAMWVKTTE